MKKEKQQGKYLRKLADAAVDFREKKEASEKDKAFLTRQLVQATLPHSNPGDVPVWGRTNGHISLVIRPGWDNKKNQTIGYPYGTIPRLLLFWLTTEALRTRSRRIEFGNSLSSFMRELGLIPTGGRWGSITRLRNQMDRLFQATISFESLKDVKNNRGKQWLNMQVAPKGELWWDLEKPEQSTLFDSWVELGEDFYNAIVSAPVPLDMRALKALKSSSLALDIYAWATYKVFSIGQNSRKEQFIPWKSFMEQLGVDYGNHREFGRKCRESFRKVRAVYPALVVEYLDGGFRIESGDSAVAVAHKKSVDKPCE